MRGEENNHENKINEKWKEIVEIHKKIKEAGGFENYLKQNCNLEEALEINDFAIVCIDEGIPWGGIHLPGSGVLLEQPNIEKLKEKIEEMKNQGIEIKGVYSHEGCGAVAKMMKEKNIKGDQDEIAQKTAKDIAENLGLEYLGHIKLDKMQRERDFHNAGFIYYTNLWVDWEKGKLPRGFTISRNIVGEEQALEDLKLARDIAFSDHGFGKRFTEENPLYIVVFEKEGENIEKEVEPLVKENIKIETIKVKVDNK